MYTGKIQKFPRYRKVRKCAAIVMYIAIKITFLWLACIFSFSVATTARLES